MQTLSAGLDRGALVDWYHANRRRSAELFDAIDPGAYYTAPIPLRHPFVFYEGHLPAFSVIVLHRNALRRGSIDRELEDLFQRGIDPSDIGVAEQLNAKPWPSRETVQAFSAACDAAILDDLQHGKIDDARNPHFASGEAYWNILEHEEMHHETLTYIIHQLPLDAKRGNGGRVRDELPDDAHATILIPAGSATLGKRRADGFGWDNEFEAHVVDVAAFEIDKYDVTNGEYLAFVRDGGNPPPFWVRVGGEWRLRTAFDEIPLPTSWPVYATHEQAEAFAAWSGGRLPTEAEYHRAAFGTPEGDERAYPWGEAAPDHRVHGNFGFRRFDPEPIGSSPAGASAFGVHDLIGNGWEWTASTFAPFPGFKPMVTYPVYSADFFDGKHYVMKGASPVTSRNLVRRSLRNWFYGDYPHMYATFRTVYDAG